MSELINELDSLLCVYVCNPTNEEQLLLEDKNKCGLKVYVYVNKMDNNIFDIRTELEEDKSILQDNKCTCQSRINEHLHAFSLNMNQFIVKNKQEVENIFSFVERINKNGHFYDCDSKEEIKDIKSDESQSASGNFSNDSIEFFGKSFNETNNLSTKSSFYIKCQTANCSHISDKIFVVSVETVVTKLRSKCEIVFKTTVLLFNGKLLKFQRFFTRSLFICHHKDNESSHTNINNDTKKVNGGEQSPQIDQTSLSLLSGNKKKTKPPLTRSISKKSSMRMKKPIILVSSRSVKKYSLLTKPDEQYLVVSCTVEPGKTTSAFKGQKACDKGLKNSNDNIVFMDSDENSDNKECIVFKIEEKKDECNCWKKKCDRMADSLQNNNIDWIQRFNKESGHFLSCPYNSQVDKKLSPHHIPRNPTFERSRKASVTSLNSLSHVNTILEKFFEYDQVRCTKNGVKEIAEASVFDEFQMQLLKVLPNETNPESLGIFLYIIRVVVRMIDDPCFTKRDDIERVLKFSRELAEIHYLKVIKPYKNLMNFIERYGDMD